MTPKQQYIAFYTLFRKEVARIFRIWQQTILSPVITTLLYFLIFGAVIGSQVANIKGHSFVAFIIPGLMMSSILSNSYINTVSTYYGAKFQRCIEELIMSPTPDYLIVLGYVLSGMIRGLITALIIYIISLFFVSEKLFSTSVFILVAVISAFLFSCLGFINGIFADSFDDTFWVTSFIITPLTYLGGVFYSIDMLPNFFQNLTKINPIYYIVSSFRYGYLGIDGEIFSRAISIMLLLSIAAFIACVKLFKSAKA